MRFLLVLTALVGLGGVTIQDGWAQNNEPFATLYREVLAKAQPDECYYGLGDPRNVLPVVPPAQCQEGGTRKVNQAYVWGLAKSGENLWFGTMANTHCLVLGAFLSNILGPHEVPAWVCEYEDSQLVNPPYNLPAGVADWRPPKLYVYNLGSKTLTPKIPGDAPGMQRLGTTIGIRSAGTMGDVVFLGGPALTGGVNLFAFHTGTGAYIGSANLPGYNNIRRWVVVNGVLYTGVGTSSGGAVLRWNGSAATPFVFEEVGRFDGDAAELAFHEGRLFVGTWPSFLGGGGIGGDMNLAGLWMSPLIPGGGLTSADADSWTKVWEVDDYEPDPVTAATYGMGAMASFDGYLYWGTMHVPFVATYAHFLVYEPEGEDVLEQAIRGTWRAIAIFRGRNFGSISRSVELLYGESFLPVYLPASTPGEPGVWLNLPNRMGLLFGAPRFGASGFGNPYNNYTWTMSVFNGQLFVGTMDWSYLIAQVQEAWPGLDLGSFPEGQHGADLFRFVSSKYAAVAESLNGVGNFANYGIRTVVSDDALYLGMANPMNLLTDPMLGGWELLRLTADTGQGDLYTILPSEGPPGTRFSITVANAASGFGDRKGVVYLGNKKAKVLAWGNTSIHCQVPGKMRAGTYPVKVKPRGQAAITLSQSFTVTSK